ncbi:MAG: PEP-CTERM sorting domain-containing protein [Planctomycetaceae bacterium]|nr:PEP-CTERM sorting domain-containing protein [Planctomycetaceae bacterium]
MEKISKIVICVLIICSLANFASAGMWWTRGVAGSTYQKWTFDDTDNPAAPEIDQNPYGDASAAITVTAGTITTVGEWRPDYQGRSGVWIGDTAVVDLTIPNNPITNDYKEIWIEVGCRGHFPPDVLNAPTSGFVLGTGYDVLAPTGVTVTDLGFNFVELSDGWRTLTFGLGISPNPSSETIRFTLLNSGAYVDYIAVDTICIAVPEPATLAVLGFGAILSLIGRKKR